MNKHIKRDIILALLLIALSAAALILIRSASHEGEGFEITVKGELLGVYDLKTDRTIDIDGICIIEVSGGEVFMRESNCRDKTCVRSGKINKSGESIICLPNGVVIRVLGESEHDFLL